MNIRKLIASLVVAALAVFVAPAMATNIQCTGGVYAVTTGDPGAAASVQIALSNGPYFVLLASNVDTKQMFALAISAKALGKTLTVTFLQDANGCSTVAPHTPLAITMNN